MCQRIFLSPFWRYQKGERLIRGLSGVSVGVSVLRGGSFQELRAGCVVGRARSASVAKAGRGEGSSCQRRGRLQGLLHP